MNDDAWHYDRNGVPAGPLTADQIGDLIRVGEIGRGARLWRPGLETWVAVEGTQFAPLLSSPTASPPPLPPFEGAAAQSPATATAAAGQPARQPATAPAPATRSNAWAYTYATAPIWGLLLRFTIVLVFTSPQNEFELIANLRWFGWLFFEVLLYLVVAGFDDRTLPIDRSRRSYTTMMTRYRMTVAALLPPAYLFWRAMILRNQGGDIGIRPFLPVGAWFGSLLVSLFMTTTIA